MISCFLAACVLCSILVLVAGCGSRSGPGKFSDQVYQNDSAMAVPDILLPTDTVGQFFGWLYDRAVMRDEVVSSVGETKASFYVLDVNGARIPLDREEWRDHPSGYYINVPGMKEGLPLVVDFINRFDSLQVVLSIDADSLALERVYEALATEDSLFPAVETQLTLRFLRPHDVDSAKLWHEARVLAVYLGDSGYQFRFPSLETAVLSPDNRLLYFKLVTGDREEHRIVVVPGNGP